MSATQRAELQRRVGTLEEGLRRGGRVGYGRSHPLDAYTGRGGAIMRAQDQQELAGIKRQLGIK